MIKQGRSLFVRYAHFFFLVAFLYSSFSVAHESFYLKSQEPPGWECELKQGVWLCQGQFDDPLRKDSLIMTIASDAQEWDTLENYMDWLKKEKLVQTERGQVRSKVLYVRKRVINTDQWIDSLQFNSEIPGFFSRYLSTLATSSEGKKLAVLVTFIVSERSYSTLQPKLEKFVESLKVKKDIKLDGTSDTKEGESNSVQQEVKKRLISSQEAIKKDEASSKDPLKKENSSNFDSRLFVGIVLTLLLMFILLKPRKKLNV